MQYRMTRSAALLCSLTICSLAAAPAMSEDDGEQTRVTSISDMILYGVDSRSHELIRYDFGTDRLASVGQVQLDDGTVVHGIESLAYIPGRPYLFAVWNYDDTSGKSKLITINLFTAQAAAYQFDTGSANIQGMVAVNLEGQDANRGHGNDCDGFDEDNRGNSNGVNENGMGHGAHSGCWRLFAVQDSGRGGRNQYSLISINPDTGRASSVMSVSRAYTGLAAGDDLSLFATEGNTLWALDVSNESEASVGSHILDDITALTLAGGADDAYVDIPGFDDDLSIDGALFGFTGSDNTLTLFDKTTGEAVPYESSLSDSTLDGIVVLTRHDDPKDGLARVAYD
ncbi:MAG: hypothetical protein D8M59_02175 [Planctomycetes bacterium]|nr:hypothetical protein [Planctomycetota bacterium]NOG54472.1 hypothetical protein [Planctomycetota bacterium]